MSIIIKNPVRALCLILIMAIGGNMLMAHNIYGFDAKSIKGSEVKLEAYQGKVILIVNTASKCGFTGQYDGLQELYEKYEKDGLVILGFPANNFLNQEPGDNTAIADFCKLNYGVSFPMFAKISVRGRDIHPLYKYLTDDKLNPGFGGKISWNFNKFLISREGKVIGRFGSSTTPQDKDLVSAIEAALK